jgi:hypothetical protein
MAYAWAKGKKRGWKDEKQTVELCQGLHHLHSTNRLPRLSDKERHVAQLRHTREKLEVIGEARFILERRFRLILLLRQRLGP